MERFLWWCVHLWSNWSEPKEETSTITYNPHAYTRRAYIRTSLVQRRTCYRCDAAQERIVRVIGEEPTGEHYA